MRRGVRHARSIDSHPQIQLGMAPLAARWSGHANLSPTSTAGVGFYLIRITIMLYLRQKDRGCFCCVFFGGVHFIIPFGKFG